MKIFLITKLHLLLSIINYVLKQNYIWIELQIENYPEHMLLTFTNQLLFQLVIDNKLEEISKAVSLKKK